MTTNTITIDNDNNAVSSIDNGNGGVVSASPVRPSFKWDLYYRRPKHFPKVGTRIGNRRITAVGEDREGFLVVAMICDNGHRTYCRWYALSSQMGHRQKCWSCAVEERTNLTDEQAQAILNSMNGSVPQ